MNEENESYISILEINFIIDKVISYDASSNFRYFYPRFVSPASDKYGDGSLVLDKLPTTIDLIRTALNHLIEVFAITYDEFCCKAEPYITNGLRKQISLKDLVYSVFTEEYVIYIRPLLRLSSSWIQVENSYDKYYFLSREDNICYRIDPYNRMEIYTILEFDITSIQLQFDHLNQLKRYLGKTRSRIIEETMVINIKDHLNTKLR